MSAPIYINKDAEYLYELGQTFLADDDIETGMRLCDIAASLQRLDDRVLSSVKDGEFAAGVREAYNRVFAKSNLPPNERAPTPDMRKHLDISAYKITKVPRGKSAFEPGTNKLAEPKAPDARLAGIKINLGGLKRK